MKTQEQTLRKHMNVGSRGLEEKARRDRSLGWRKEFLACISAGNMGQENYYNKA